MNENIFARIVNNRIVQFPVTVDQINERDTPTDLYYRCFFPDIHPEVRLHEKVVYTPRLVGEAVYVFESVETRSTDEMFDYLYGTAGEQTPTGLVLSPSKVTDELYLAFVEVVKHRVQKEMDVFARTREYDDVKSACDYVNSVIPTYKAEAQRCIYLRDMTWSQLFNYLNTVRAGSLPLPQKWEDIAAYIPPFTWED